MLFVTNHTPQTYSPIRDNWFNFSLILAVSYCACIVADCCFQNFSAAVRKGQLEVKYVTRNLLLWNRTSELNKKYGIISVTSPTYLCMQLHCNVTIRLHLRRNIMCRLFILFYLILEFVFETALQHLIERMKALLFVMIFSFVTFYRGKSRFVVKLATEVSGLPRSVGVCRQATSLQNFQKCWYNLAPEYRQPTEPEGKVIATICDRDNNF